MSCVAPSVPAMSQSTRFLAPMGTVGGQQDAVKFALRSAGYSLAFFGLIRLDWIESHVVLPLAAFQGALAFDVVGAATSPVEVTLACSGADALALCVGSVLAYPVPWRTRGWGAIGGTALILSLNVLRIGTLGQAAGYPVWFDALHSYAWPALLMLGTAGYVFTWMSVADRRAAEIAVATSMPPRVRPHPSRRFVAFTIGFLLLFAAAAPLYLESSRVLAAGGFIARATAGVMTAAGLSAHATSNVLWTPRGAFLVTQECVSTPLIPIYLAFVCAYSRSFGRMVVGVLAALPLFTVLAILRLLVVALPDAIVPSPLFFVHAFYQLLLGAVIVCLAAVWRHGRKAAPGYAVLGVLAAGLFAVLLGPGYTRAIAFRPGPLLDDPQGAIAVLPAFQTALYLGLWAATFVAVGWGRFIAGLAALTLTQTAGLLALHALSNHWGISAHVRDIRGWAIAAPVLIFAAVVSSARAPR